MKDSKKHVVICYFGICYHWSQGKTKTTEGKTNERNEKIIMNTAEAPSSFPGCALLWKNLEPLLTSCLNLLYSQAKEKTTEGKLMRVMSAL